MKLQTAGEDYLKAMLVLEHRCGAVRSVDLARYHNVTKPTISYAVNALKAGGFLTMDEDFYLHLTDLGRQIAEKLYERHCFFTAQLTAAGVDYETAAADACRIEHVISDETFACLKQKLCS